MPSISIITSKFKPDKISLWNYALCFLFAVVICYMAYVGDGGAYLAGALFTLVIVAFAPMKIALSCICFAYPFLSVLKLPIEVISLVTSFNLIFIVRTLMFSTVKVPSSSILSIFSVAIAYQVIPMFFYNQTIGNIILFTANLLMLVCVYRGVCQNKLSVKLAMEFFTLGVLGSCWISKMVNSMNPEWMRFTGFWPDPNFLGMFCLIGIAVCLNHIINSDKMILAVAVLLGLAFYGFMTVSRTFVVVGTLMVLVYCAISLKRGGTKGWIFLAVVIGLAIAAIPYVEALLALRGFDENNLTNNRTELSGILFEAVTSHIPSLLAGIGYANDHGFWETFHVNDAMAAHNSFVDYFAYFGLVGVGTTVLLVMQKAKTVWHYIKSFANIENMPYLVMIFYMGTLSMLKYAFLFLLLAFFIAENRKATKVTI